MVRPMRSELPSPEIVYAEFAKAATAAVKNVQDFSANVKDSASQEILQRARESKEANDEGVVGWLVAQHEDWLDKPVTLGKSTVDDDFIKIEPEEVAQTPVLSKEEAVEAFKRSNPGANVIIGKGDNGIIRVRQWLV